MVGQPVAATVKVPDWPLTKVALLTLVKVGLLLTVRVKDWLEEVPTLLAATTVKTYTPPVPAAGVPLSTPALLRVTPVGNGPFVVKLGIG